MKTENRTKKIKKVVAFKQPALTVVIEDVHDPHNVSAILRSCDAVGVIDVHLVYVNETFPKMGKKSSAGTRKWINRYEYNNIDECFSKLKDDGFTICTTHMAKDSISLYDIDFSTKKIAIVIGNEHRGVSERAVELSDINYLIPMYGMVQSLNVSVATAVSLYEASRQLSAAGKYDKQQFSDVTYKNTVDAWLDK